MEDRYAHIVRQLVDRTEEEDLGIEQMVTLTTWACKTLVHLPGRLPANVPVQLFPWVMEKLLMFLGKPKDGMLLISQSDPSQATYIMSQEYC